MEGQPMTEDGEAQEWKEAEIRSMLRSFDHRGLTHDRVEAIYACVGTRAVHLDLQLPVGAFRPFPVIMWLFGGGWAQGGKDDRPLIRLIDDYLLAHGYAIISVEYRLSQEARFPAQLEDCKAAVRWVRAHARHYGLDADAIGAWGFSSGGHLAALLGTTGSFSVYDRVGLYLGYSSAVQAVCTFAAPTDLLQMSAVVGHEWHDAPDSFESRLLGGPLQERADRAAQANPVTYLVGDTQMPPFLILHGDRDTYVPVNQAAILFEALRRAGREVTLYLIPGGDHGLKGLSEVEIIKIVMRVRVFFDAHLRHRKPTTVSDQDVP